MMSNADIKAWLAALAEDAKIGVDEGGVTLVVLGDDRYLEVGGIPNPDVKPVPTPPPPRAKPARSAEPNGRQWLGLWVRHKLKGTEWQVSGVIGVTDGRLVLTDGHETFFADEVHET